VTGKSGEISGEGVDALPPSGMTRRNSRSGEFDGPRQRENFLDRRCAVDRDEG
jgi:hypothetical protein